MLMDSVEEDAADTEYESEEEYAQEQVIDENTAEAYIEEVDEPQMPSSHKEPSIGNLDGLDDMGLSAPREAGMNSPNEKSIAGHTQTQPAKVQEKKQQPKTEKKEKIKQRERYAQETTSEQKQAEQDYSEPDEVLIMNVMSRPGEQILGADLLNALMSEGLKFGEMEIFHRHKANDGDGPILYSVANMVMPGTFNLAAMESFQTPGISIFLSLPVAGECIAAYNDMATTAKNLAEQLGAELKDENRSVMTAQTIEHGRQRVVEYERKRKLAKA
ncbi:MAG: cell division protein ZipA [Agarilytica sp.]